jgi:hypothetical protein
MEHKLHYGTVTEALTEFRKQGFNIDFNLAGDVITHPEGKLRADEFEIVDVYRYEGNTDPADEATVYAIKSTNGLKGVLVAGYGASEDTASTEILKKLR